MTKKLMMASLLSLSLMLSPMVASATEITLTDYNQTGATPSNFGVTEDELVNSGIKIILPANLDLTFNDKVDAYTVSDSIGVVGGFSSANQVKVSTDAKVVYTHQTTGETIEGYVRMGETLSDPILLWNSVEAATGVDDANSITNKPISVNVLSNDVTDAGDWAATIEFDIGFVPLGLYADVCGPSAINSTSLISYIDQSSVYNSPSIWIQRKSASDPTTADPTAINLSNIRGMVANYDYGGSREYGTPISIDTSNVKVDNCGISFIQMESVDGNAYYASDAKLNLSVAEAADLNSCVWSWCNNLPNLQVVVVPGDMTPKQLHCAGANSSEHGCLSLRPAGMVPVTSAFSEGGYSNHYGIWDGTNLKFTNTNTTIGNALCFYKGDGGDNRFAYVPHIVYRGNIADWKALSGSSDWVFGNAANIITVHCYDGVLYY